MTRNRATDHARVMEYVTPRKQEEVNNAIRDIIKKGVAACQEHRFSFIQLYKLVNEENVKDGWDLYTISPVHLAESEYYYCGVIRADGTTDIRQ